MLRWLKLRMFTSADETWVCWVWWHATWLDEYVFGPIHDRFCANCKAASEYKNAHMDFLEEAAKDLLRDA